VRLVDGNGSVRLEAAGVLCVSRGVLEAPKVGGRGLGVCGELGIYSRRFNFYKSPLD